MDDSGQGADFTEVLDLTGPAAIPTRRRRPGFHNKGWKAGHELTSFTGARRRSRTLIRRVRLEEGIDTRKTTYEYDRGPDVTGIGERYRRLPASGGMGGVLAFNEFGFGTIALSKPGTNLGMASGRVVGEYNRQ